jgi:hypothetical protein
MHQREQGERKSTGDSTEEAANIDTWNGAAEAAKDS